MTLFCNLFMERPSYKLASTELHTRSWSPGDDCNGKGDYGI